MENNQSVQQEPPKVKESAPTPASNASINKVNSFKNVAIYLFTHYPWLFLAGLLLMFLGGGALSIYSLGYVDESLKNKESQASQTEVAPPQAPAEAATESIPLWMVAAIALSCASGCLVILRFINRPRQKQKIIKRVVSRDEIRLSQRRYQAMEARLPKRKTPAYVSHTRRTPIMAVPPQKPHPKPVVTVLPPEHSFQPNQNNQDSLADIMDIRKQNSLSSMLHK